MTSQNTPIIPKGLVVIALQSQRFVCVGHEKHQKPDGTEILLAIWMTKCRVCGVPIEGNSVDGLIDIASLRKNCPDHKYARKGAKP